MELLCARPIPSSTRPPAISLSVRACAGEHERVAQPDRDHGGAELDRAGGAGDDGERGERVRAPRAAPPSSWLKPSASAAAAWAAISEVGRPRAMSDDPLIPMRIGAS